MTNNTSKYNYIIADHIRASCFLIADGVMPGPKQQGYILRRLIRRSLSASLRLNIDISNPSYFKELTSAAIKPYDGVYPELKMAEEKITELLLAESQKYLKAVDRGYKEWQKELKNHQIDDADSSKILAKKTWDLYQTHGVPIEISLDVLEDKELILDKNHLQDLIDNHQKLSQSTSAGQFKSGLGEHSENTIKLHTATHLLHQTLKNVLDKSVNQHGSAITPEKARFDFNWTERLTDEQLQAIQTGVQKLIDLNLTVNRTEMSPDEARSLGAIGLFGEKYGDLVSVYTVLNDQNEVFSREFCTGPHVKSTSEIGKFSIIKQESLGQGLKRLVFKVE